MVRPRGTASEDAIIGQGPGRFAPGREGVARGATYTCLMALPERVAFFLPTLGGGGAERNAVLLAQGFADRGVAVDVVVATAVGPNLEQVPPAARLVDLSAGRVIVSLPRLVRYLRRERPQVVVATQTHASVVAIAASRLARAGRRTRVLARQQSPLTWATKLARVRRERVVELAARLLYPHADLIVANSRGTAEDLARRVRLAPGRVAVIRDPVVTPGFFAAADEQPEHPWLADGGPPVVLAVGRHVPEKGFGTLVRAIAELARRGADVRLVIAGEGPGRGELGRLAASLGLDERVSLPGWVGNPYSLMRRCSCFVISSVYESMPNALLQALACGAPAVATDYAGGSPRELIEDGFDILVVPPADPPALADAIASRLAEGARPPSAAALHSIAFDTSVDRYLELISG